MSDVPETARWDRSHAKEGKRPTRGSEVSGCARIHGESCKRAYSNVSDLPERADRLETILRVVLVVHVPAA